jgi:hypothetical protein
VLATPGVAAAHDGDGAAHQHDEPGTQSGETPPAEDGMGTAESDAIDIALIAGDTGWSLAATRRHMANQVTFGALQDEVTARFPASFAGAEFAESPGGKSYLRFKGAVPSGASALAAASGLDVGLTGGRRYSAVELGDRTVAVLQFFGANGYQVAAGAVLPSGQIEVAVVGQPTPGLALPPALRDGVRVTFTDEEASQNFHTYGGAYIHTGSAQCTTGFSVEEIATGTEGVTTAAHCDVDHYHQPNTNFSYQTFEKYRHLGGDGDIEWHTGPGHDVLDDYFADPTDLRDVASVETSAAVNNTYCVYSRMQGTRTCDQVWSTFVAMLTWAGLASNLVGMDDNNVVPGESGGPWSYSTEAVGTVVGEIWLPFGWHDTFSRAWRFDTAVGVVVKTIP